MLTRSAAERIAADARDRATLELVERGVNPSSCPRLLAGVEHGTMQVAIAVESERPQSLAECRRYLDGVYKALAEDPTADRPPRVARWRLSAQMFLADG